MFNILYPKDWLHYDVMMLKPLSGHYLTPAHEQKCWVVNERRSSGAPTLKLCMIVCYVWSCHVGEFIASLQQHPHWKPCSLSGCNFVLWMGFTGQACEHKEDVDCFYFSQWIIDTHTAVWFNTNPVLQGIVAVPGEDSPACKQSHTCF